MHHVAGVVWLTVQSGQVPWIGLGIALSFGAYGLLRKIAVLGSLEGLTLETILLSPLAFVGLLWWWSSTPDSFPAPDLTHGPFIECEQVPAADPDFTAGFGRRGQQAHDCQRGQAFAGA